MTALFRRGTCSICRSVYSGSYCPNCGWWNRPLAEVVSVLAAHGLELASCPTS